MRTLQLYGRTLIWRDECKTAIGRTLKKTVKWRKKGINSHMADLTLALD